MDPFFQRVEIPSVGDDADGGFWQYSTIGISVLPLSYTESERLSLYRQASYAVRYANARTPAV